jgi:hypothetical protein
MQRLFARCLPNGGKLRYPPRRAVNCGEITSGGTMNLGFCLYVVRMPRQRTNSALDQYELAVDEIVTACDGDLRSALRALMLLNEQLEQELTLVSSGVRPPDKRLH